MTKASEWAAWQAYLPWPVDLSEKKDRALLLLFLNGLLLWSAPSLEAMTALELYLALERWKLYLEHYEVTL